MSRAREAMTAMTAMTAVTALLAGVAVRAAHAQGVDVADLPPLPSAADAPSSSATVLAAVSAEGDVVVGAAKREQSLGTVASAVTVVSGDRIRRFGYRTVGEAVAAVAGVYLVDNRLSYSIGIRGLQIPGDFNTRLLVLIDGATVNEAWGSFAGVGYDALVAVDDIARIEVIRGPVSSVYGTSAFFAILNIVTRGASETPRAWGRVGAGRIDGVTASAGFAAGGVHRQLRGSVHVMDRSGDTTTLPELPGLALTGDGAGAVSASLVGAYNGSFAQVRAVRHDRQSPFAPYDVNPAGRPYEQHGTQLLVEGGHTRELTERFTLAGRLYGNFYKFDDRAPAYDPVTDSALVTAGTAQVVGGELRGRYEVVAPDRLGVTAGAEASHDRTRSTARTEDDNPRNAVDVPLVYDVEGVYAELDAQPTAWLGLTAGLRYDRHAVFDDRVSPRVAVFVAAPERYGVKLLYAEGFRNASAFESYFDDRADFSANPRIRPEGIRSFEAVAWARPRPGLALRASGYHWGARDIIEQRPHPDPMLSTLQFQNVARYVSQGVEAEASYRDRRGWYAFGGFALTRVGRADRDEPIGYGEVPNAPALTASGGVSTPRLFDRVHVSAELVAIGERPTRRDAREAPSPASPAWLGGNLTIYAPSLAGFDVTAGVRNLLGTRPQVPAPGDYDRSTPLPVVVARVPGEGRELYVKIGYAY